MTILNTTLAPNLPGSPLIEMSDVAVAATEAESTARRRKKRAEQEEREIRQLLANLLSSQKILVRQHTCKTAMYNHATKTLHLPLWNISKMCYQMLIGHEVGHAIWSPGDYFLQPEVQACPIKSTKSFKIIENILEDIRIEKLIKSRYPGFRRIFNDAYKEMDEKGFFRLNEIQDLEDLTIIDRINLHFKLGVHAGRRIPFTSKEVPILLEAENILTYTDVIAMAEKIFQHITDEEDDSAEQGGGKPATKKMGSTQNALDENLEDCIRDVDPPKYMTLPEWNSQEYVVGSKEVIRNHRDFLQQTVRGANKIKIIRKDQNLFLKENIPVVNYLVKEFEMKKAAWQDIRRKVGRTGVIDCNRLATYRYKDDIFKRFNTYPSGKNHGLVMFIDWSGSMGYNLAGTIDQLLNLVLFCKKAQIPFEVYSFTSNGMRRDNKARAKESEIYFNDTFALRQFFTDRMSFNEFNMALQYMLLIRNESHRGSGFAGGFGTTNTNVIPPEESLGSTPLNQCIVAARDIIDAFKKRTQAQIVNTVFLTDSGDTDGLSIKDANATDGEAMWAGHYSGDSSAEFYLYDPKTRKEFTCTGKYDSSTAELLGILKDLTDTKVIGFEICNVGYRLNEFKDNEDDKRDQLIRKKYVGIETNGFDMYYLIPQDELALDESSTTAIPESDDEIEQFKKLLGGKVINRMLLSNFIEQISTGLYEE